MIYISGISQRHGVFFNENMFKYNFRCKALPVLFFLVEGLRHGSIELHETQNLFVRPNDQIPATCTSQRIRPG